MAARRRRVLRERRHPGVRHRWPACSPTAFGAAAALLLTQSLMLAQAIVLAALTALGHIEVWHLIVLALWLGIVSAFDIPLRQSLYVHLVEDRADLPNAIALNSLLVNAARVVGPGARRAAARRRQRSVVLRLNALSFVAVIVAVARMHWPNMSRAPLRMRAAGGRAGSKAFATCSDFAPARALLIAGRGARVDDRAVFVADADLRQGRSTAAGRTRSASCSRRRGPERCCRSPISQAARTSAGSAA